MIYLNRAQYEMLERYLNRPKLSDLNEAGKEELALMIVLWKDFKCNGKLDVEISKQSIQFAQMLDIVPQFEAMLVKCPPMKITPRYE